MREAVNGTATRPRWTPATLLYVEDGVSGTGIQWTMYEWKLEFGLVEKGKAKYIVAMRMYVSVTGRR